MITPSTRLFLWSTPLLALSLISVVLIGPRGGPGHVEAIGIGYLIGSLFGHTTVAAAWAAYGPGRLLWRVILSLVWVCLLVGAIALNMQVHGGPDGSPVEIGVCFLAQWLALQLPLWGLRTGFRSKLQHFDEASFGGNALKWQFGIRQLMIVTTVVGVLFGIGRLSIGFVLRAIGGGEFLVLLFLAGCAIVFSLPLLIACLLRRRTVVAVVTVLVMVGIGTILELPLLRSIAGPGIRSDIHFMVIAMNASTAAFVLLVALVVRLNGFALARSQPG